MQLEPWQLCPTEIFLTYDVLPVVACWLLHVALTLIGLGQLFTVYQTHASDGNYSADEADMGDKIQLYTHTKG